MDNQKQRTTSTNAGLYSKQGFSTLPKSGFAVNYYLLALFVSAAVFFIVWAALHDGYDDSPLILAAGSAGLFALSFVVFREVVFRNSRRRQLEAKRLSQQLRLVGKQKRESPKDSKLTLQRNEEILHEIRTKSEAAKVLGKFADAHKEVFDMCDKYLSAASLELATAHPSSPRISALTKGTASVSKRHRFHMLRWAEINALSFTTKAQTNLPLNDKIHAAESALLAVDNAVDVYPNESALVDSQSVLRVFLTSARVKLSVHEAEQAVRTDNIEEAVIHYHNALSSLEKYDLEFEDRRLIYDRIRAELSRIQQLG